MTLENCDWNELEALKFSVRRALSTLSLGFRGKYTNVKYLCIDVPLSPKTFCRSFAEEYSEEDNFKKIVSVDDLNSVFGVNWHCFQFEQSNTTKRVIGNVQLHFRKKQISAPKGELVHRYTFFFIL